MIREWCEGCGERLTLQWSAMHCREIARCPARCGCDDRHTIGEVAEWFWTAIAHERAKFTSTNCTCGERACGCSTSEKGRV